MKTTNLFSLLIVLGALTFAGCQGSGGGADDTRDSVGAIERSPDRDNTGVDESTDTSMGAQGEQSTAALDENTRTFLTEAASGNMMEIQLGELAQQKATNARVKEYAAMIVRDHTRANEELRTITQGRNVTISNTMEDKHRRKLDQLRDKEGVEFDRAYMKHMVDDHQEDIRKYEEMAREASDPAIRNYANTTLTTLRAHLEQAKAIRDEVTKNKSGQGTTDREKSDAGNDNGSNRQ